MTPFLIFSIYFLKISYNAFILIWSKIKKFIIFMFQYIVLVILILYILKKSKFKFARKTLRYLKLLLHYTKKRPIVIIISKYSRYMVDSIFN